MHEIHSESTAYRWYHKLGGLLFAVFCFELGVFLLVFPWLTYWDTNYFAWFSPNTADGLEMAQKWRAMWLSPYVRGGVSGLGLVNIYVAIVAASGLRRYAGRGEPMEEPSVSVE